MKALQINVISFTEGTKRSLPVKPVNKLYFRYITRYHVYVVAIRSPFFSCDLNLLYEDLISLVFILASFLQLRKARNQRPAKFSTNEVVALYGMLFAPPRTNFLSVVPVTIF